MCKRVVEVAGEAMLRYVHDKNTGSNMDVAYTIYKDNGNFIRNYSNNYNSPIEYVNARNLKKVKKRQY